MLQIHTIHLQYHKDQLIVGFGLFIKFIDNYKSECVKSVSNSRTCAITITKFNLCHE